MSEQVVELDSQATAAIASEVVKSLDLEAKFAEQSKALDEKIAEIQKAAVVEKEASKLNEDGEVLSDVEVKYAKMDKVEFAAEQFKAWVNKDSKTLKEMNEIAIKSYAKVDKATYLNTATAADGGAIVPNGELLTDVFTTLGNYSEVAADLRVITLTSGNTIDVATLVQDVVITEVSTEGGNKTVTKMVLGDGDVTVREMAGIAIFTKKLVREAAINVYDLLRESFARAIATKRASMALTDSTSGIVNQVGVVEVTADGDLVTDYTWKNVASMPFKVPAMARAGGKYYISGALLEQLALAEKTDGSSLELVNLDPNGVGGTFKNGYRFAVEPGLGENGAPHAVFGAMGRYGILVRSGSVEDETFDTGIVVDGASTEHNLLQQNKLAQRVAFFENVGFPIPGAFAVLVAGASS